MAKFLVTLSVGLVGCKREAEFEIDDEDLEGLSEQQREEYINEDAKEIAFQFIDWNWKEVE